VCSSDLWLLAAVVGSIGCSSNKATPVDVAANPNESGGQGFRVDDNSLNPNGAAGSGAGDGSSLDGAKCLTETEEAEAIGLDMYVMLDISGSMLDVLPSRLLTPPTKWDAVRQSLENFVQAPATADIGIGIQYFPQVEPGIPFTCTVNSDCGSAGPCRNSVCVQNSTLPGPRPTDPALRFLTVVPNADATAPINCTSNADCGRGQTCTTLLGECVLRPDINPAFPQGSLINLSADPNTSIIPVCSLPQDCAGLPNTSCDETGACQNQPNIPCSATVACPNGAGPCLPFPFDCVNQTKCETLAYSTPAVEIGNGPTRATDIINSIEAQSPQGLTPTGPALSGALQHAQTWAAAHSDRQVVTVLATDGFPTECTPLQVQDISRLASNAARGNTGVRTFVIGVFGSADLGTDGQQRLDSIAKAGGTDHAFVINTGSGNVAQDFLDALNQIRDTTVSCEFRLDASQALDFDKVNLQVTDVTGSKKQLVNVGDASACGSDAGWYYVNDPEGNPTQISVCPSTCGQFMAGNVKADLQIGCATLIR